MGAINSHELRANNPSQIIKINEASKLQCSPTLSVQEREMLGDNQAIVAAAIFQLKNYVLLSIYTRALLIQSGEHAINVCHALKNLDDAGLFSIENIDVIARAPEHVSTIVYVLTTLNKKNSLRDVSRATITLEALKTHSRGQLIDLACQAIVDQAIKEREFRSDVKNIEEQAEAEIDSKHEQSAFKNSKTQHPKRIRPSTAGLFQPPSSILLTAKGIAPMQAGTHSKNHSKG